MADLYGNRTEKKQAGHDPQNTENLRLVSAQVGFHCERPLFSMATRRSRAIVFSGAPNSRESRLTFL
jgi:hypothetical protein